MNRRKALKNIGKGLVGLTGIVMGCAEDYIYPKVELEEFLNNPSMYQGKLQLNIKFNTIHEENIFWDCNDVVFLYNNPKDIVFEVMGNDANNNERKVVLKDKKDILKDTVNIFGKYNHKEKVVYIKSLSTKKYTLIF